MASLYRKALRSLLRRSRVVDDPLLLSQLPS
jgi:hypothetical protein